MDTVSNIGLTVPITKANGPTTKQKAKAHFGTQKAMSTEVSSKMIWLMVMANTLTLMAPSTKVNLGTMCKRVMEKKNG